jgi:hypothetical protein
LTLRTSNFTINPPLDDLHVKLLLKHGADPGTRVGGLTPLGAAAAGGGERACRVLVEGGAAVDQPGCRWDELRVKRCARSTAIDWCKFERVSMSIG